MEDKLAKLPKEWVWAKLEDIGIIASGGTPSTKDDTNFDGEISWITPADLSGYKHKFITKGKRNLSRKGLNSSSATLLPFGTILFSSRAPIGYVAIAANDISTNQGFKNLILQGNIFNEFVYYYLKGNKNLAESFASGTTFLEISASKFSQLPIPIPPTPEQHRIVAKIEELFTRLDAGVEALKKIKAQLKRYRQAVLKYAFEGKLTQEWREVNKGKIEPASVLLERIREERKKEDKGKLKELPPMDTSELPELPEGWCWITWGEISEWITYGFTRPMPHIKEGIPIITAKHVINRKIDLVNCDKTNKESFDNLSEKDRPKRGDILITKDGTIGRAAVVTTPQPFCINQSVAVVWLRSCPLNRFYLLAVIDSPFTQKRILEKVRGVALMHLSITDFAKMPLPIPSVAEQEQIVAELDRHFSVVDNLEQTIDRHMKQASLLRKSILKRAFEGKLVPQDPTDEPAEKLLDRIKEEKVRREAANRSEKKHRNKKSKQMELI